MIGLFGRSGYVNLRALWTLFALSMVLTLGLASAAFAQLLPESTLRINDVTVTEGDAGTTNATFTVTRSGNTTLVSTVNYATADDTATQPSDYASSSGPLTFSPGETTKTVAVTVKGDTLDEANETFIVNLSSAVGATISDGQGVGTITDDDDTPQANDDGSSGSPITLDEDDPDGVTTSVLANDSGLGDTPIEVVVTDQPGKGTATIDAEKTITYVPQENRNGGDTYEYTITDSDGQTSTATVFLHITPVNDAPSFTKGADQTVNEDAGAQTVNPWATNISKGPDNESGQTVSFVVTNDSNPSLFSAGPAVSPIGVLTYTPAANANGSATVKVKNTDDGGTANGGVNESAEQTFTITVRPINDVPEAKDDTRSMDEDGDPITIDFGALVEDLETSDANLTYNITDPAAAKGTLTGNGSTRTFDSAANFNGAVEIAYGATDRGDPDNCGATGPACVSAKDSDTKTVTVTVNGVNDAPSISEIANQNAEAGKPTAAIPFTVGDVETAATDLTLSGSSSNTALVPNSNISFGSLGENRTLAITPVANKSGTATITVAVSDGALTATDTFVLTVTDTTAPTVIKAKPTAKKVSPSANIVATFSEAMMRSSLNKKTVKLLKKGTTKKVAATLSCPAPNKVVLNPRGKLVRGAIYKVTIVGGARGAKDRAGNALAVKKVWKFRVR